MHTITIQLDDYDIELLRSLTGHKIGWPSDVVKKALKDYIKRCAREKVVIEHNERIHDIGYAVYLRERGIDPGKYSRDKFAGVTK